MRTLRKIIHSYRPIFYTFPRKIHIPTISKCIRVPNLCSLPSFKPYEPRLLRAFQSAIMPPIPSDLSPEQLVEEYIKQSKVIIFSKSYCPFCNQVRGHIFNTL